jgi:Arc/MetJ family transcription regulator
MRNNENDPQAIYTHELEIDIEDTSKRLIDIDEEALAAARASLGKRTLKDTVNESLRMDPAARLG